jgi:hypothetical protein
MIEKYLNRTVKRKDVEERMINSNLITGHAAATGDILQD